MAAKNDITGDSIVTKSATESYRSNWDLIFGKKKKVELSTPFPEMEVPWTEEKKIEFVEALEQYPE